MTPEQLTDLTLLKVFMDRDVYTKYIRFVHFELLDEEIKTILKDFGHYFDKFGGQMSVNMDEFPTWFHHYRHPDLPESKHQIYKLIFSKIPVAQPMVTEDLLQKMQQLAYAEKIRSALEDGLNVEQISSLLTAYERHCKEVTNEDADVVNNNLDTILEEADDKSGLQWRLTCLNRAIGPLVKGKFIIIAAYVDVGKTAFAISEATYMARQLIDGCVLWLNNEEDDNRVYKKIWKSVLGCGDLELKTHREDAKRLYLERMNGDLERIKFVNIRKKTFKQIIGLFEKYKPKLCVIDQVDKIVTHRKDFFSDHERLKDLYGEIRTLANQYCPILAISQADVTTVRLDKDTGDVEYQLYPHHRQLDGSKVGKPGEADAIIMIGRRADYPGTRGIHVSKNKFGDIVKQEVIFNGEHIRYENP